MSYIVRRSVSTLIPPKVASPQGIGAAKDAARMRRLVDLYEKLPRGAAPEEKASGLLGWYRKRYIDGKGSAMPIVHLIALFGIAGYAQNYYFHLRHHKNNAH